MKKFLLFFCLLLLLFNQGQAQDGFAWGVKSGLTLGFQKWNNSDRDPLFTFHGAAFIETLSEENRFTLFAQGGYHKKGSAIRIRSFVFFDPATGMEREFSGRTTKYEFNNLSISLGAKQKYDWGVSSKFYYLIGLRGDYTVSTNLADFENIARVSSLYPLEIGVNRFNYGAIFGGGAEFELSELISIFVELTINPDFSRQYYQPPIPDAYDPFTMGTRSLPEQSIRNNTVELSVGFRFIRSVEYIEDDY
ncbi:MAG: outer membrane beta-barrel protein [Bacteroidota bacterium]